MTGKYPGLQNLPCLTQLKRLMSIAYGRPGLIQTAYGLHDFPDEKIDDLEPVHVTKKVAFLSGLHFKEIL